MKEYKTMGYNIAAYVEKRNRNDANAKWELVGNSPVSSYLKYVFNDFDGFRRISIDELSDGMKEKFTEKTVDGNGEEKTVVYSNFYVRTLAELEADVSEEIKSIYTKLNVIVRSLGCINIHSDDGEELDIGGYDDENKNPLTFPINKKLIDDIQLGFDTIRNIGEKEAFNMFVNEKIGYDDECRVIFAYS